MLSAYKQAGYGMELQMSWSAFCFVVAAVLFVDDCDLLHMCVDPDMSDYVLLGEITDGQLWQPTRRQVLLLPSYLQVCERRS
jgi:hypothetical protein